MNRRDLNRRKLLIEGWLLHAAGLALTAAGLAAVVVLLWQPAHAHSVEAAAEIARLDVLLKSAAEIRAEARDIRRQIDDAEARNVRLAARVPTAPHEADFLGQMTALAHQVELEIHDYRPGVVRLFDKHGEMEVQFNAQGTYAALCQFLHRTEELPRLCRITRLEIKAPLSGDKTQIDITLLIYFAREQPARAANGLHSSIGVGLHCRVAELARVQTNIQQRINTPNSGELSRFRDHLVLVPNGGNSRG
jgi:Tfp pilus assembly protein PilO